VAQLPVMGLEVAEASLWRSWAVTALLWLLVAVGAVGGMAGLFRPVSEAAPDVASVTVPELSAQVAGTAEWAVRTAVPASTRHEAGRVLAVPTDRSFGLGEAVQVLSASTIDGRVVDESYWAVTVAAEVDLGEATAVLWFFEVGVADTPDGPVVVSEPALVPAPAAAEGRVTLAGTLRAPDLGDPAVETTAAFLTALLSGDPSVGRWTAPGVELTPAVGQGTFDRVTVERAAVTRLGDDTRRVLVAVTARTTNDTSLRLVYEVTVAAREGRWEITAISGAPTMSVTDPLELDETRPAPAAVKPTDPNPASSPGDTAPATATSPALAPDPGTNPNPYEELEEES
jgi:hypothetical protein